ncbi:hypothetical protein ACOME3_008973 [Neoechinorhynchus agilis]
MQEHSKNTAIRVNDICDEKTDIKSAFISVFSNLFTQPAKSDESSVHSTSTAVTMPTVCPRKLSFEWKTSSADNVIAKFHPSGSIVAIGGYDRKVDLWSVDVCGTTNELPKLGFSYTNSNGAISALEFDDQGSILYSGSIDYALRLYSVGTTKRLLQTHTGHTGRISAICACSSNLVATSSHDRTIKLWDVGAHQCSRTLCVGSSCLDMKLYSMDGPILVSSHHDKSIRLYDDRQPSKPVNECSLTDRSPCISLCSGRQLTSQIICCLRNNRICIIDSRMMNSSTKNAHIGIKLHSDCQKCDLSADGSYLAVGCNDGITLVFDVKLGALEQTLQSESTSPIICTCWQPCQMNNTVSSSALLTLVKDKMAIVYK